MDQLPNTIRSHWNGEQPLWKSFWVYGLLAVNLFSLTVMPSVIDVTKEYDDQVILMQEISYQVKVEDIISVFFKLSGLLIIIGFMLNYLVWNFVSVWRCARNTSRPFWRWSARAWYVIVYGLLITGTYLGVSSLE